MLLTMSADEFHGLQQNVFKNTCVWGQALAIELLQHLVAYVVTSLCTIFMY